MNSLQQRTVRLCAIVMAGAGAVGVAGVALGAAASNVPATNLPSAPLPAPAQLMALVFPGWGDSAASHLQTVILPGPMPGHAGWGPGPARVIAEPRLVLRTDADHVTLIAGLTPVTQDGKPAVGQLTPMALAAYQFEQHDANWAAAARQGVFAWRGFYGTANVRAIALSPQRQGIGVEYGSCWDGYCGTWLALYEVDKGAVRREPAVEMALSGSNTGSAADCPRRLQPLLKPRAPETAGASAPMPARESGHPDSHDCYAIESSWTIAPSRGLPGDLTIRYQGAMSRAEAYAAPPAPVDQRQVLRYGSGKYRAISGFNPVPPI
jgi:hypothetical protein